MQTKLSPYRPVTPELAATGLLIPIKQAAAEESACETTLKANAKARRLRAFQQYYGAPVLVLPADVEEFLKSRTDIASKHHPKGSPAIPSAGHPPTSAIPPAKDDFHFPNAEGSCGAVGDLGIGITLHLLAHSTPSERALVANTLFEIARAISGTVPADSGNQNQQ